MEIVFNVNSNREVYIASQNKFDIPIKHPSRTLNEHIISYLVKGNWVLSVGDEVIDVSPDNIFIQPANLPHIGLKDCPPGTHTLFVHFSVDDEDGYEEKADEIQKPRNIKIKSLINAKNNPEIKETLIKIIDEHAKGNYIKAASYLNIFLWELSEVSENDKSPHNLAVNMKKIIANNVNDNLSNKEIAKKLGVGLRTAETIFKNSFGVSIHQYQLSQKIERAMFYLEYYPEMKIIDIALNLGFYDEYHFSRQFKKITGLSPTKYKMDAFKKMNKTNQILPIRTKQHNT